jgi:hypothetical protein
LRDRFAPAPRRALILPLPRLSTAPSLLR